MPVDLSNGLHGELQSYVVSRFKARGWIMTPWGYHDKTNSYTTAVLKRSSGGASLSIRQEPDLLAVNAETRFSLLVECKTKPDNGSGLVPDQLHVPIRQLLDNMRRRDSVLYVSTFHSSGIENCHAFYIGNGRESWKVRPQTLVVQMGFNGDPEWAPLISEAIDLWKPDLLQEIKNTGGTGTPYLVIKRAEIERNGKPLDDEIRFLLRK